jgi:transposase
MNLRPTAIRDSIDALMRDIAQLRDEVAWLRRENEALRAENAALGAGNAALRAENAELRRRVDLDSSNSSKPPSSDGLKKKPRLAGSLRGRSGEPSGGQPGHKGDTLNQVEAPDRIERHTAEVCRHCFAGLGASMQTGMEKRQGFDLPERRIEVTEHQASVYRCGACGFETTAEFPAGVAAATQSGERVRAAAIYLNLQPLIPEDRVAQTMNDLFGAPYLCAASLTTWVEDKAAALAGVAAHSGVRAAQAPVRHPRVEEPGDRLSRRRKRAVAAYGLDRDPDLLPGDGTARRRAARPDGRRCRPRPFQAL